MALMTVRYARTRAASDPDRDMGNHGRYYGNSMPGVTVSRRWVQDSRTTRGAWIKRVTD